MATPHTHNSSRDDGRLRRLQARLEELTEQRGVSSLVLRAFLGVTFTFAGLQKLSNPDFFNAKSQSGFQAQLQGAMTTSPIRSLLHLVTHAPVAIAVIIACSEVAIGLGTFFGLFGRLAAVSGMLLSLSFFLTISYTTSPYYYGSDIVFAFAWTPLVLGGSGAFSLDAALHQRYVDALSRRAPHIPEGAIDRRAVIRQLGILGFAGIVTSALIGSVVGIGHAAFHGTADATPETTPTSPSSTTTPSPTTTQAGSTATTPTTAAANNGTKIAVASAIKVGSAKGFTDPSQQIPAFLVHADASNFVAFSAVCTHAGCTVSFNEATTQFDCSCHGSVFDATTGAVMRGPATRPLPSITVSEINGDIYTKE